MGNTLQDNDPEEHPSNFGLWIEDENSHRSLQEGDTLQDNDPEEHPSNFGRWIEDENSHRSLQEESPYAHTVLRGQTYKEYEPSYFTLDASGNLGGQGRGLPIPQRSLVATLEYSPGYFPGEASGDVGGGGRDAPIQPWSLPL